MSVDDSHADNDTDKVVNNDDHLDIKLNRFWLDNSHIDFLVMC